MEKKQSVSNVCVSNLLRAFWDGGSWKWGIERWYAIFISHFFCCLFLILFFLCKHLLANVIV
uniref:Uncharacterized protein n=1 Tax=Anopheles arabiensis TaxID=7173 RepID=A0A182IFA5_ANOAR